MREQAFVFKCPPFIAGNLRAAIASATTLSSFQRGFNSALMLLLQWVLAH